MRRIWISLIVLPWLLAFSYTFIVVVTAADSAGSPFEAMLFAVFVALFAYLPMGLVATPALFTALRFRRVNVFTCLFIGALTSFVVVLCLGSAQLFDERLRLGFRITQLLSGYPLVLFGAIAGVLFWLLGIWRSPLPLLDFGTPVISGAASETDH